MRPCYSLPAVRHLPCCSCSCCSCCTSPACAVLAGRTRARQTAVPGMRRRPSACCCCQQVRSRKPAAAAVRRLTQAAAQLAAAQARTPAALLHRHQLFSSPARQLDTAGPTTMQPPHSRPPRLEAAALSRRSPARSPPQGPWQMDTAGPTAMQPPHSRPPQLGAAALSGRS